MSVMLNLIKADFMKLKRTSFYLIHICMPLIGAFIFLLYYFFSPWESYSKVQGYLEVITIIFPIIIAIIISIAIEKEYEAGKFKELLGNKYGREKCVISKMFMLLLSGLFSLTLAIGIFYIGFYYILKETIFPLRFYIFEILIIFGSEIFTYIFHLWINFSKGSGISIMTGIFESLVSALIITGLGDRIWVVIPCSWPIRFCSYFILNWNKEKFIDYTVEIAISVIITIIVFISFILWFRYYERRDIQ